MFLYPTVFVEYWIEIGILLVKLMSRYAWIEMKVYEWVVRHKDIKLKGNVK